MYNYYISTDQTADFPKELIFEDFGIIPMSYCVEGILYDGIEHAFLSPHDFYSMMSEGKNSTTSMVSVEQATEFFGKIFDKGQDVLHISFSSALSGCYNSYIKAAEVLKTRYPERSVKIVDSKCASAGEGLLLYYTLKRRETNATFAECYEYAAELSNHIGHSFTVSDMHHLYRGGRVGRGTAMVGSAININPVLMVNEKGELIPIGGVIGRKKALRALVDKMEAKSGNYKNDLVIIAHGDSETDALALKALVNERFGEQNILITDIGAVIGSHCGKGVIALFYLSTDKYTKK